jgi:trk system potassium uptake protein
VHLLYPRVIVNALAVLSAAAGAAMLVPAAYSLLTAPNDAWVFWLPGAGALALGVALFPLTRRPPRSYVSRQTIFFMVVVGWLGVAFIGSVPFFLSGLMGPVDALFNSMAGFTTTGAATVTPEQLSPALLLWRSISQWIGCIGVIVLFAYARLGQAQHKSCRSEVSRTRSPRTSENSLHAKFVKRPFYAVR